MRAIHPRPTTMMEPSTSFFIVPPLPLLALHRHSTLFEPPHDLLAQLTAPILSYPTRHDSPSFQVAR